MSSRRKSAALAKYREARNQGQSALDQLPDDDKNDDIYEYVEEDEYHHMVEKRREREDFVVDDDGLGYYDDGEERFGDEDNTHNAPQNKRSANATLTAQALKKARKNASIKKQEAQAAAVENNTSMWNFVNRGSSVEATATPPPQASNSRLSTSSNNVDDLLAELDAPLVVASKKRGRKGGRKANKRVPPPRRKVHRPSCEAAPADEEEEDDNLISSFGDDDDDNHVVDQPTTPVGKDSEKSPAKSVSFSDDNRHQIIPSPATDGKDSSTVEVEPDSDAKPVRRRFARAKLGQISAPAQKALEKQQIKQEQATPKDSLKSVVSMDTTSASFKPQAIAAETSASNETSSSLEQVLQRDGDSDSYMDLFYTDLCERNGDILLFGKVAVQGKFISTCVVVEGNLRNLFVLPRQTSDGTPTPMVDVHAEINKLLHGKNILPRQAGASWASKVVKRKYAFEDKEVPREETQYLKVVYKAAYPVPSEEICEQGGETFSKILGAGASTRENFIVKRKLMGPCWVRITKPSSTKAPLSWCKLECVVASPKQVFRCPENHPVPPLVTLSLKFKTVVNPGTHKSEIVSVSAVCHKNVLLDTASDESSKHMTQLSIIRPLSDRPMPRDLDAAISAAMPQLRREMNERALLNRLMAQIGQWDPDVIVGHNALGYDLDVILARCQELKVSTWSKVGRRRRRDMPKSGTRRDYVIADAMAGRLLCDTYLSAKEFLQETTYSLTNLAATQLKVNRQDIEAVDIPQWFQSSKTIVQLAMSTLCDAQLVQRLMFKLQVLPLTKQLTCIAGNLWSHTLKSQRAERTEYLLLHEFHRIKYLPPEKKRRRAKTVGGGKAKYSGGLVLDPKKGLYDSFILLLDFNSLYPSIIQEYNLCFTTIDWSAFRDAGENEQPTLAPIPESQVNEGVLPRVIKTLVERRRNVKKILKGEKNQEKREELDIRQKALKLTANAMYGCLGFSNSRFFAQPIAALVTAKGRETLQRTVEIAENEVGLDVIYGDTDSIMINTCLSSEHDLPQVRQLGERVKKEVNRQYRTLELEIDGIFRSMLLLKKKKYAAKTVQELPNGEIKYGQELKGLDLVRRDWCVQSKDTGRYVTGQILSGQDSDVVMENIHTHLNNLAQSMRNGELAIDKYVITKGLSKHPNDYPDAKSLPHVQVAKMMLKNNRPVNTGDHIPYVVTAPIEGSDADQKALSPVERARHPEEIARSNGVLKPDIEWYLTQQILPPIGRLCEPIEGMSLQSLAETLGLDSTKYNNSSGQGYGDNEDEVGVNFTPASLQSDTERFKGVEKLHLYCQSCNQENDVPGVFHTAMDKSSGTPTRTSGMHCTNPDCPNPRFWGYSSVNDCQSALMNKITMWTSNVESRYYQGLIRCDEVGCGLETRQLSVAGGVCLRRGCNGRMFTVNTERDTHNHLKYLESLFDWTHACEQLEKQEVYGRKNDFEKGVPKYEKQFFANLHTHAAQSLQSNAFNWISAEFWKGVCSIGVKQ